MAIAVKRSRMAMLAAGITKFPAKGTSDPNGDREINWSQDGVAYFLKSFDPISDDELLGIANEISAMEAKR